MKRKGRFFMWLSVVIAAALILPSLAFWLAVFPAPIRLFGDRIPLVAFRILDFPTSALNAALPFDWRSALAAQFVQGPMASFRRRYLIVGFSAYLLLGVGMTLLYGALAERSRRRSFSASAGA